MKRLANLLIIGPTPPPVHGVSRAIEILINSKLKEAFSLIHLDLADRRGIEFVNRPDLRDVILFLRQWVKLVFICLKNRPDMVYLPISQTTVGFFRDSFFIFPCLLRGSKVVLHLHSGNFRNWYEKEGPLIRAYVQFILKRIDRIIVLGHSLKPLFDELIEPEKVSVVPNGLAWPEDYRPPKAELPKNDKIRILHLSTLTRLKGVLVFLNAIPLIVKKCSKVEFLLAGNWFRKEDQEEGEKIVARENLSEFVTFKGEVTGDEKVALFGSSDLFVFPGIQEEGQPLVLIEAMAAGLPVIFTDRGAIRETVINGTNGLEARVNDVQDLADKILWILNHPEERKKMALQSRKRYENGYTQAHFERGMIEVLELVGSRGSHSK